MEFLLPANESNASELPSYRNRIAPLIKA